MRPPLVLTVCATVAALCALPSDPAIGAQPLPVASVSPTDGAALTAASPVSIEISSPDQNLRGLDVIVTASSVVQPDGELETGLGQGLAETGPGLYRLEGEGLPFYLGRLLAPGKYYWQVEAGGTAAYGGVLEPLELSPVFWFIVGSGSPRLTLASAVRAIKSSIRGHTRHDAWRLKDRCASVGEIEVECSVTWATSAHLTESTVLFTGSFRVVKPGGSDSVSFNGVHERYACGRHGGRACPVKIGWSSHEDASRPVA